MHYVLCQSCDRSGLPCFLMQGLVKAVGVSNYGPRQLEKIHRYLSERGVPLASAQVISQGYHQYADELTTYASLCEDT